MIGVIIVRNAEMPFAEQQLKELEIVCHSLVILDPDNLISNSRLFEIYNHAITSPIHLNQDIQDIQEILDQITNNDWVFTLYDDEIPSPNLRYQHHSLCMNPYINTWMYKYVHLWDNKNTYRVDKNWCPRETERQWRYIPEIDYKWGKGLVPTNQPGPAENAHVSLYTHRYIDQHMRTKVYWEYISQRDSLNYITKKHYESIYDKNPILRSL